MKLQQLVKDSTYVLLSGDPAQEHLNGEYRFIRKEGDRAIVQKSVLGKIVNQEEHNVPPNWLYTWNYLEQLVNPYWEPGY